jgi:hypothetical protein
MSARTTVNLDSVDFLGSAASVMESSGPSRNDFIRYVGGGEHLEQKQSPEGGRFSSMRPKSVRMTPTRYLIIASPRVLTPTNAHTAKMTAHMNQSAIRRPNIAITAPRERRMQR